MSHTPYSDREAWSDITPLPQIEPSDGLVPIMYSPEYSDAMSYFRAIVTAEEHSDRVLDLTEHIIRLNPAHYTVWQYRMKTLLALKKDLTKELRLMDIFAEENLKSYQVWHHRLTLLTHISPLRPQLLTEISFIHNSLLPDPKNYHTWSYLHWLYSHFSALPPSDISADKSTSLSTRFTPEDWANELKWCESLLDHEQVIGRYENDEGEEVEVRGDERNNSGWGWRWYLCVAREGVRGGEGQGVDVEGERRYALKQIETIPHNASAWNYLRGLHKHFSLPYSLSLPPLLKYTARPSPSPSSTDPTDTSTNLTSTPSGTPLPVPFALEWQADALVEEGREEGLREAGEVFEELGRRWDTMRRTYWNYRKAEALKKLKALQKAGNGASAAQVAAEAGQSVPITA